MKAIVFMLINLAVLFQLPCNAPGSDRGAVARIFLEGVIKATFN